MGEAQPRGLVYRKNRIDFDSGAERQARAANGNTGVYPLIAEDFDHQIRGGVEHLGMVGKARSGVDEAVEAQQLDDAVEIAQRRSGLGQDVKRAKPRRRLALAEIEFGAKLAGHGNFAVGERQLAGNVELAVEVKKGHVAAKGGSGLRQNEVERLQPCFDLSRHMPPL